MIEGSVDLLHYILGGYQSDLQRVEDGRERKERRGSCRLIDIRCTNSVVEIRV